MQLYDFSTFADGTLPKKPPEALTPLICETDVKGCCLAPKSVCALDENEISRIYTLTKKSIETYSLAIPRKLAGFDQTLFPDTIDTSQATLTSDEWLKGETKTPNLVDVQTLVSTMNKACGLEVKEEKKDLDEHIPKSVTNKKKMEEEKSNL
eukprot:TRINITY_DN5694_c0_g1_i1.p1 TRINITY_DN5694_c0_g1~~TRINITY_DN5694_c0_g1_i1.p1  ORF type:complete len:152 (+),score=32.05 TRINITY_DN5694_c0_g1_i1:745-1200(+)